MRYITCFMIKSLVFCLALLLHLNLKAQPDSLHFTLEAPPSTDSLKEKSLWATQYYIHAFTSGGSIPLRTKQLQPTGLFADTCDFCTASLEGTAFVKDSSGNITVLNYDGIDTTATLDCRQCKKYSKTKLQTKSWGKVVWRKTDGFGDGVMNFRLIPFRTIAVDPKFIPYGTVIYIPSAKGKTIVLPDGKKAIHDGYFFAGDTGGAIKENHVDLFTGIYEGNPFVEVVYSNPKKVFEAYVVNDTAIIQLLTTQHLR